MSKTSNRCDRLFFSYVAVFTDDEREINFRFPDLCGAGGSGNDFDEARKNAEKNLMDWLHWRIEFGDPVPAPTPAKRIFYDAVDESLCAIEVDLSEYYPEGVDWTRREEGAKKSLREALAPEPVARKRAPSRRRRSRSSFA